MIKFLPILLILLFLGGGYYYLNNRPSAPAASTTKTAGLIELPKSNSTEDRLSVVEKTVALLTKEVGGLNKGTSQTSSNPDYESRIKKLEDSVAQLKTKVDNLPSGTKTTTQTTTSTNKAPSYVPLGWNGSAVTQDWSTITGQDIYFNASDYPGYTSIQFEVNLRVYQGNGRAYARMYNSNDGTAILTSEISSTSQDYVWATSAGFTLPSAQKTYKLQIKSLSGYSADVQNARIKINY